MKIKIAVTAIMLILLASAGFVTYAFLTANASAHNIITAGTVNIELSEVADGLRVMPATTAQREVIIKNTGANDCYVRVRLNTALEPNIDNSLDTAGKIILSIDNSAWLQDSEGYWRYIKKLVPGEATTNLLTGISFDKSMGNEFQNAALHIYVSAQAVQAANNGFDADIGSVLEVQGWPEAPAPLTSLPE